MNLLDDNIGNAALFLALGCLNERCSVPFDHRSELLVARVAHDSRAPAEQHILCKEIHSLMVKHEKSMQLKDIASNCNMHRLLQYLRGVFENIMRWY